MHAYYELFDNMNHQIISPDILSHGNSGIIRVFAVSH